MLSTFSIRESRESWEPSRQNELGFHHDSGDQPARQQAALFTIEQLDTGPGDRLHEMGETSSRWSRTMTQRSALKRWIRTLAAALQAFATEKGWKPDEYHVYVRVNKSAGRIHCILEAPGFEGIGDFERYVEVRSYLESRLRDDSDLFQALGLVVRIPRQIEEGGLDEIGPEYTEVRKQPARS